MSAYSLLISPIAADAGSSTSYRMICYPWLCEPCRRVGDLSSAPYIFGVVPPRLVSSYALIIRWLLPSRLPSCPHGTPSFATQTGLWNLSDRSGLFPSRLWTFAPRVCLHDERQAYSKIVESWYDGKSPVPQRNSTPPARHRTLYLNRFRRLPANAKFDWLFTPSHKSSPSIATDVSSVLQMMVVILPPAHG